MERCRDQFRFASLFICYCDPPFPARCCSCLCYLLRSVSARIRRAPRRALCAFRCGCHASAATKERARPAWRYAACRDTPSTYAHRTERATSRNFRVVACRQRRRHASHIPNTTIFTSSLHPPGPIPESLMIHQLQSFQSQQSAVGPTAETPQVQLPLTQPVPMPFQPCPARAGLRGSPERSGWHMHRVSARAELMVRPKPAGSLM
jgi:hypothetical protein